MNIFELERLKAEGKDVVLSGGRRAIDKEEARLFCEADERIDGFYERKRFNELLEDTELGIPMQPRLLGC